MRWTEAGLFLAPFLLYAAWRASVAWARPSVGWVALAAGAVMLVAPGWVGLSHRMAPGQTYVPARLEDGKVVPGHGVRLQKP